MRSFSVHLNFKDEVEQIRQIYTSCQGNANEDWQEVAFKVLKKLSSEATFLESYTLTLFHLSEEDR